MKHIDKLELAYLVDDINIEIHKTYTFDDYEHTGEWLMGIILKESDGREISRLVFTKTAFDKIKEFMDK